MLHLLDRQRLFEWGGSIAQWLHTFIWTHLLCVRFPVFPKKIQMKKIANFPEVNQWSCLEESGQWLENVYQTHLELASGRLVLQKRLLDY